MTTPLEVDGVAALVQGSTVRVPVEGRAIQPVRVQF